MMKTFFRRFFMPYLTGAACSIDESCPIPEFPHTSGSCQCDLLPGGVNELYFIPCNQTFSQTNLLNIGWWNALLANDSAGVPKLGRSGLGLGSIDQKNSKSDRVASCKTEQKTVVSWAIKFIIKCFDKTAAKTTHAKINQLVQHGDKYLLVARMCAGENEILPVGIFTVSDFGWTVPDNFEENQNVMVELSWNELGVPVPLTVPGLSAVLPKLS